MVFDSLTHGELADSRIHEKKVLKNTYYCSACARSFVSQDEEKECRFCSGPVAQLHDDMFNKIVHNMKFHYYCDFCNKDFIFHYKPLACVCGTPVKRINRLDRTTLFEKLGHGFPVVEKLRERCLKSRTENTSEEKKFSLKNLLSRKTIPKLSVSRNSKEEFPTDYVVNE